MAFKRSSVRSRLAPLPINYYYMIYQFKEGSRINANANKVQKELQSIGEEIKPLDIVEFAKKKRSELHKCSEWNNDIASEKYRIHQARKLINSIIIIPEISIVIDTPGCCIYPRISSSGC